MDWENIRFKIDTEFHMLRHFRMASVDLTRRLIATGYTQDQMLEALSMPGSRFHTSFATSIQELIKRINGTEFEEQTGSKGNLIFTSIFSQDEYKEGIGTLAIIDFDELNKEQQKCIYLASNRGYKLKHLNVERLPSTRQLTIILTETESGVTLITSFPGKPGFPIPHEQMNKGFYEKCAEFWNQQVFLIEKKE